MEDPSIRLALQVVLKVNLIYFNNFNCCQEHRYYKGYFGTYKFFIKLSLSFIISSNLPSVDSVMEEHQTVLAIDNLLSQPEELVAFVRRAMVEGEEEGVTLEGEVVCLEEVVPHMLQMSAGY